MEKKKKRLLLINPINPVDKGFVVSIPGRYPPLGLGYVAALTPSDWEVYILDEAFKPFAFRDADLVGFTAFTFTAPRAYELAAIYRERGIPTVLGGIHASMMPEEARQYMDAVVIGEAESAWPQLIADFEAGQMKNEYHGGLTDLKNLVKPRHDLFHPDYWFASIFTTRGCPSNCSFCSVTSFNGAKQRFRPVEEVLDEIAMVKQKLIFFVDDNIIGYGTEAREHALAIFKGMAERKLDKIWFSQASLNFGDNDELLQAASNAGCRMILLGIESEKAEQLKSAHKNFNLKRLDKYSTTFRNIHKHNIAVLGTFIFGLDGDNKQALYQRAEYILRSEVDAYQTTILTPLPGTTLYKQMVEDDRLLKTNFPADWSSFQFFRVNFKPKSMHPVELFETMVDIWSHIYRRRVIEWKAVKTFWNMRSWNLQLWFTRGWQATLWAYHTNWIYRNLIMGKSKKNRIRLGEQ
ncbi:MAG: B12-binding domain-containing radical SAM protein [Bacteroidetes bacterium]|nr:B12-binding domain-containing radical SAM protein [Bacteroidota bacterium]